MEDRIELPLEVAYRHLCMNMRNLGFIVRDINESSLSEEQPRIVFSVSAHPDRRDIEYFSLVADEENSTVLRELDLTGNRWLPTILYSWLRIDDAWAIMENVVDQVA